MKYVEYLLAAFTIKASGASLVRQIYTLSSGFQLSISPKANTVPIPGISTSSRGNPNPTMGVISVTRNLSCNNKMISPTLTGLLPIYFIMLYTHNPLSSQEATRWSSTSNQKNTVFISYARVDSDAATRAA